MPISALQKEVLVQIFKQLDSHELVAVTGCLYNTLLESNLGSEKLMALGKCVFANYRWSDIPKPLNNVRYKLIQCTNEFFFKSLVESMNVVPDDVIARFQAQETETTEQTEPTPSIPQTASKPSATAKAQVDADGFEAVEDDAGANGEVQLAEGDDDSSETDADDLPIKTRPASEQSGEDEEESEEPKSEEESASEPQQAETDIAPVIEAPADPPEIHAPSVPAQQPLAAASKEVS